MISGRQTMRQLVWWCDKWLRTHYRNEHVYRVAVLDELLKTRRVRVLPEFRIRTSQVDFIVIQDDLHAVEVKSEHDTLDRLETQIADYRLVAPRITVVAPQRLASRLLSKPTLSAVGVSTLLLDGSVEHWRVAEPDPRHLSSAIMLSSLRRREYVAALESLGYEVPRLPNTQVFGNALTMAGRIDPGEFLGASVVQLAQRQTRSPTSAIVRRIPRPLRPVVLRIDPSSTQLEALCAWLDSEGVPVCPRTARAAG